ADCPQLAGRNTLEVDADRWSASAINRLLASPHLDRVTALALGGELDAAAGRALAGVPLLERLNRLDLHNTGGTGGIAPVLMSAAIRRLDRLTLSRTGLTADFVGWMPTTMPFTRLRSVALA